MDQAFTERRIVFRPNVQHWRESSDSAMRLSVSTTFSQTAGLSILL